MTRLVSLAELLGPTGHDNGSAALFDADSLEIEAGPDNGTVVIHGGKNASGLRKLISSLSSRHPEVTLAPTPTVKNERDIANAVKDAISTPAVNEAYPLPSVGVLAGAIGTDASIPKGAPSGMPAGAKLEKPAPPTGTGSPSETPVDVEFEAQDPQPDGEVLQPHQAVKPGGSGSAAKKQARDKTPSKTTVKQDGSEQSTTASTLRSPRPAAGSSDRPAAGQREQEKT
jgi:hypothetical protein